MLTVLNDALPRPRWMALSADPVFRGLVGLAVIGVGVGHLALAGEGSEPTAGLTGASLVVLGGSLAAGLWTRLSALLLLVIWSVTTLPGAGTTSLASGSAAPLLESLAILGALFLIYVRGGGQISLDGLRRKRSTAIMPSPHGRTISRL
ncbi:DoxX family protein [Caulobacter sp. ErkDOM-YI]|uniref:DoxX family protein n=1 Tax=unclassified Caulobacter TaxID=2648921 RepID=UPI003AF4136B